MSGLREVIFYVVAEHHDGDEHLPSIQFSRTDLMGPIGKAWDTDCLEEKVLQPLVGDRKKLGSSSPASSLPKRFC